jgi:hypothetical protein
LNEFKTEFSLLPSFRHKLSEDIGVLHSRRIKDIDI